MTGRDTVLIGFGRIGAALADDPVHVRAYPYATHAQVLRDHPAFNWRAVIDVDPAGRAAARERWAVPEAVAAVEELGERGSVRLAVIATPPASRPAILDALPNLEAVLVEKPLADDIPAGRAFLDACRNRGIHVAVNLPRRYDPLFRDLAGGGLELRIGRPLAAFGVYGNGLRNNGTHLVDLVRMLLGEVTSVQAIADSAPAEDGPIAGDASLAFGCRLAVGPAVMVAVVPFSRYREVGLDVWGERGRLQIVHEGLTLIESGRGPCRALSDAFEIAHDRSQVEATDFGSSLYRVYDNLADILEGGSPYCSGDEALRTMRVVEAARRSHARAGAAVEPAGLE